MATYLSQPYQGSEFVSGVPIDLIARVGMMKQARYDQTKQEIQSNIDMVGTQDIIKDSERDYRDQKLDETVGQLNSVSGVDLSDSNVASQLRSYVTGLSRDKRIYNAVADTKIIRNHLSSLQEIKEKKPEEYASQNEALFMQGINSYLTSPSGTRYSGQGYIPYYNYDQAYRKVADEILKNPDIQNEINYGTDPITGKQIPRGYQEVKQVTKDRIQSALLQSGDQRAIRQMQIDYQTSLPNKTIEGAISELRDHRLQLESQLKDAKDIISKGVADPQTLASAKSIVTAIEGDGKDIAGYLKQVDGKISEVRLTDDPTKYYSFDKYIKDFTGGLSSSLAYRQEGKIDYDDIFMENLKFQHNTILEGIKSANTLASEKAKNGGVDPNGFTDNFKNSFMDMEVSPNHEANIDTDGMRALFDGTKNEDGSFTVTLSGPDTYLNIGKIAEASGIQETNSNKLNGLNQFNSAYSNWSKKNAYDHYIQGSGGIGTTGAGSIGHTERVTPTLDEFIQSADGKKLADQIKQQTGLDVTSSVDKANLQKFASSPQAQALVEYTNKLSNLRGQVKVRPMDGQNIFSGSDNQYYGKMQGLFTRDEINNSLGGSGFKTLLEAGLIQPTLNQTPGRGNKEGEQLYAIPLIKKVSKDITSAYTNYMTGINSGDNFYVKNLPGFQNSFKDDFTAMASVRGMTNDDLIKQANDAVNKAASQYTDPADTQKIQALRQIFDHQKSILNSQGVSSYNTIRAKKALRDIAVNSQNYLNLANQNNQDNINSEPTDRQAGQTVGEYANNPANIKHTDKNPIIRMYGGTNSGIRATDGGTFAKFPDLETGYKAYQAQLFGPSDGLYTSDYYGPSKTVDQAMKSWSNFRIENGKTKGYNGDIYPEIKNKKLKDLTLAEREELSSRMLNIENNTMFNQLKNAGIIKT